MYKFSSPIVAAPLAGISNSAYYSLCLEFGAGLVYTEMVSAEAIHYQNKRTFDMCKIPSDAHPIALQLFGSKVSSMVEAAVYIDQGDADIIDINMGCPAPKVVKTGAGSALLHEPQLAKEIVSEIVKHVKKPVSVKIRLGYSEEEKNYLDFAKMLEDCGISFLAVHGRTRTQMYQGEADWQAIKEIKQALKIPVIGNGDIKTVTDFMNRLKESEVDAIMIGRGLLGNPFLIKEIKAALNGEDYENIAVSERFECCKRHAQALVDLYGEERALCQMRGIAPSYLKGLKNSSYYRQQCSRLSSLQELYDILDKFQLDLRQQ